MAFPSDLEPGLSDIDVWNRVELGRFAGCAGKTVLDDLPCGSLDLRTGGFKAG
jgi:hypothetical protein